MRWGTLIEWELNEMSKPCDYNTATSFIDSQEILYACVSQVIVLLSVAGLVHACTVGCRWCSPLISTTSTVAATFLATSRNSHINISVLCIVFQVFSFTFFTGTIL